MVAWIHDFANTVKARTGRDAVFYTSTSWWTLCTGNNAAFGNNPLWIPRYGSSVGTLPASWSFQTIWQNADSGVFPGDQNQFNGAARSRPGVRALSDPTEDHRRFAASAAALISSLACTSKLFARSAWPPMSHSFASCAATSRSNALAEKSWASARAGCLFGSMF